jgi:hypothetical protein
LTKSFCRGHEHDGFSLHQISRETVPPHILFSD